MNLYVKAMENFEVMDDECWFGVSGILLDFEKIDDCEMWNMNSSTRWRKWTDDACSQHFNDG